MDSFSKILGLLMIFLTLYVAVSSNPPLGDALYRAIIPLHTNAIVIVTLVGGTVGGYISFAGAHRLLDAGIMGKENISKVNRGAVSGIIVTGIMRTILFIASLGVVVKGLALNPANPPASVFQIASGEIGYRFFGVVMWSAAITSVVGAAYTSISFIKTFHPWIEKNFRFLISFLIIISTAIFLIAGKPVQLLIFASNSTCSYINCCH